MQSIDLPTFVTADSLVCLDHKMPRRPSASSEVCVGSVSFAPVQLVAIEPINSNNSKLEAADGMAYINIFSSFNEHALFIVQATPRRSPTWIKSSDRRLSTGHPR